MTIVFGQLLARVWLDIYEGYTRGIQGDYRGFTGRYCATSVLCCGIAPGAPCGIEGWGNGAGVRLWALLGAGLVSYLPAWRIDTLPAIGTARHPQTQERQGPRNLRPRRPPAPRGQRPHLRLRRHHAQRHPAQGRGADADLAFLVRAIREALQPNHLLVARRRSVAGRPCSPSPASSRRRSMIVKKAKPLAIECVVRGYLAGSGWKEYQQAQTVCGIQLPAGLKESAGTARAHLHAGHQGRDRATTRTSPSSRPRRSSAPTSPSRRATASLKIYNVARDYARQRGIIIADTKFEFGLFDGQADPDRRSADARFLAVLAGRPVPARQEPAELRQAIRARLPRNAGLEQDAARARAARRRSSRRRRRSTWRPTSG